MEYTVIYGHSDTDLGEAQMEIDEAAHELITTELDDSIQWKPQGSVALQVTLTHVDLDGKPHFAYHLAQAMIAVKEPGPLWQKES